DRFGIGAVLGTGTSTGLDLKYDSLEGGSNFGGTDAANNVSFSGQSKTAMSTGLIENEIYNITLELTRDLSGMTITSTANGGSSTVTINNGDDGFYTDYAEGWIVVRAGSINADFNIDDVTV